MIKTLIDYNIYTQHVTPELSFDKPKTHVPLAFDHRRGTTHWSTWDLNLYYFLFISSSFPEQNTQPEYKGTDDTGCEYTFEWTTQAACALGSEQETVDASKCQLHDDNTDFTFNLMPLKKRGNEDAYEAGGYKV